jgi:hypothetical protein
MSGVRLVPEFLLTDELDYEIKVRGVVPDRLAQDKRKQFRDLLQKDVETASVSEEEVSSEVDICVNKLSEWEGRLVEWTNNFPKSVDRQRFLVRLTHLRGRIDALTRSSKVQEADGSEWLSGALSQVDELLTFLSKEVKVQVDAPLDTSSQLVAPTSEVSVPTSEVSVVTSTEASASVPATFKFGSEASKIVFPPFPAAAENSVFLSNLNTSVGSVVMSSAASGSSGLSAVVSSCPPIMSAGVNNYSGRTSAGQAPILGPRSFFNKLPNPVEPLLRKLPVVDGGDIDQLLYFLASIQKLIKFMGVSSQDLLLMLTPYCVGTMSSLLRNALERGSNWDTFHQDVLNFFLPGRLRHKITTERVYRLQGPNESLANFVGSVKETAEILRLSLTEGELLQAILEGLSPAERSRLSLCPRPMTLRELELLFTTSHSFQLADDQRRIQQGQFDVTSGQVNAVMSPTMPSSARDGQFRRTVVCWNCGERGHPRRLCPKNKVMVSKNLPTGGGSC